MSIKTEILVYENERAEDTHPGRGHGGCGGDAPASPLRPSLGQDQSAAL